jgi:hypothetical protein
MTDGDRSDRHDAGLLSPKSEVSESGYAGRFAKLAYGPEVLNDRVDMFLP